MAQLRRKLKMIGWREWVGLPDLGIGAIKVKVDSGARTCALHATKIRYIRGGDDGTLVSFLVTVRRHPHQSIRIRAPLIARRKVKSSLGHASVRPVILTTLQVGAESWPVEVTLVNRDPMGFRMLLGRACLKDRFLIHPARGFLQSQDREDP